ncbi:MAG: PepSY-like domain-containing protein [Bacteroidales bacterium]|nr:PepSY-like domain-containing protein [Bacteroidales bacterium]MBQ9312049.1 PepSY-like domain-containing protein [Bacteroidales bacterium]
MKKYVISLATVVLLFSCSSVKKSPYKSVDQRDVPERYVNDFKKKYADTDLQKVKWEMADSNTYFANFNTTDNDCKVKFTRTGTETYYVIPKDYVPSDITDFVKENYADYKIDDVYISDIKNQKSYEVSIKKKGETKKLQFDLRGNFNKVID